MSDQQDRLSSVLSHWAPRILVSGITYSDASRVVDSCQSWADWCRAWCAEGQRQEVFGEGALDAERSTTAGEYFSRAALFYHFAQFMFFDDLDQKHEAGANKVRAYQRAAPLLIPEAQRVTLPYRDFSISGYVRQPGGNQAAAVIIVPGSDSTKEEFGTLEEYFLRRGLVTFSIDGPGQGEGRSLGRLSPDQWDEVLATARDYLLKTGIPKRAIGVYGMAFGGHLVLQGAAHVDGIGAVVCMNGFYDLGSFWDQLPEVYRANMGYTLGGADLAGTSQLAGRFSLADRPLPDCPVLVVHGGLDRIFPVSEATRVAEAVGSKADLVVYPEGNHVCNNIPYQYRSLAADWLCEKLT